MKTITEDYLKERLAAFAQRRAELLSQVNAVEGAMTELQFLLQDEEEQKEE